MPLFNCFCIIVFSAAKCLAGQRGLIIVIATVYQEKILYLFSVCFCFHWSLPGLCS